MSKIRKIEAAAIQAAAQEPRRKGAVAGKGHGGQFLETLQRAIRQTRPATPSAPRSARSEAGIGGWLRQARLRQQPITLTQASRLAYFSPIINHCAVKYGVPIPLICGVILQESGGNPHAVSSAGARGLMQLMPETARRMGVTNLMDSRQNIEGGVRYLRYLLERFKGNVRLAVAGYNCGEGNIAKYGNRIPPFAETQAYVPNVLGFAETVHRILHVGGTARGVAVNTSVSSGTALAKRLIKLA